jgi:hypothetical protein
MQRKRKYRKRKSKIKFYCYEGLKCQGKKELRFLKECIRYKKPLPSKPKRIKTPYGYYTPDFEYKDKFIEIKSLGTFKVCLGYESYKKIGKPSDKQFRKIKWVAKYVKPINIIVYVGRNEYKLIEEFNYPRLEITYKGGKRRKK